MNIAVIIPIFIKFASLKKNKRNKITKTVKYNNVDQITDIIGNFYQF